MSIVEYPIGLTTIQPCPFCGQEIDPQDDDFCYPVTRKNDEGKQVWRAGCSESAGGCGADVTGWSGKEAIQKWNTRYVID